MKIGGLYSYWGSRHVFENTDCLVDISSIKRDEPFILLQIKQLEKVCGLVFKILTTKGIVGWIDIGYPEEVKEVSQ